MMRARAELKALTGARGIAAWMVVLFHLRFMMPGLGGATGPLSLGYLAVDFFFVLSGFVIWMTYADRLREQGLAGIPDFLKRRLARVWPLHIFMLAVAAVFALVIAILNHPDWEEYPFADLPLHILLIQNWDIGTRLTWNVPAWSISCEFAAYLVFPLLAFAVDWRRLPSALLLAAATGFAALIYLAFASKGDTLLGQSILSRGVPRCLGEFAIGTIVCTLWQRWRDTPLVPTLLATGFGAMLLAAYATGLAPQIATMPLVFAALVLVLALTSGMRGNPFEIAPVHYLGEISYATYLGHWMLWMGFKLAFIHDHDMGWGLFLLFLAMVLATSVLLYRWVERPAQRWVNGMKLPTAIGTKPSTAH